MKLSRPVAVFAAVVLLAGGAAVAVHAADPAPTMLCSNDRTSAVSVPSAGGACAKGTTDFYVASDGDVRALATRLGAAETLASQQAENIEALTAADAALDERISALESDAFLFRLTATPVDQESFMYTLTGIGLKPDALIRIHYVQDGIQFDSNWGRLQSDGTVSGTSNSHCSVTNLSFETVLPDDRPVLTNVIDKGPGCP